MHPDYKFAVGDLQLALMSQKNSDGLKPIAIKILSAVI